MINQPFTYLEVRDIDSMVENWDLEKEQLKPYRRIFEHDFESEQQSLCQHALLRKSRMFHKRTNSFTMYPKDTFNFQIQTYLQSFAKLGRRASRLQGTSCALLQSIFLSAW